MHRVAAVEVESPHCLDVERWGAKQTMNPTAWHALYPAAQTVANVNPAPVLLGTELEKARGSSMLCRRVRWSTTVPVLPRDRDAVLCRHSPLLSGERQAMAEGVMRCLQPHIQQ